MEDYPQSNAEDPSALKTLLALLANEDAKVQDDVRHAYYFLCKGDPNSVSLQLSIWLAALHRAYGRVAVKSSSVNGPMGWPQPSFIDVSISTTEPTPSSSARIASNR